MNRVIDVQSMLQGNERDTRQPVASQKRTSAAPAVLLPATGRLALYRHRWISRRVLLTLTDDELRDIGLDYSQARAEAAKPFWRE
ncbi:DUF1127 domain-containing protein [Pseudomonas syringae]|nr:DUF1127 domain-containing protein [Pseudomonas syringae]MBD8788268.1 DUF1127 domain-containing protein [Pseudomonas syringae]MBD8799532.1 DUF1127 domain-containing protein [Pseudomonas syringae]MBD8812612.1 DUF1127 domain-containing protein [Pseudomonas syringae]